MISDISKVKGNLKGERVILEAVENLLATTKHSRFFNRGMYSDLEELLFQPVTTVGSKLIRSSIVSLIMKYLGKHLDDVSVSVNPDPDRRRYNIRVDMIYNGVPLEYTDNLEAGNQ